MEYNLLHLLDHNAKNENVMSKDHIAITKDHIAMTKNRSAITNDHNAIELIISFRYYIFSNL